jgi:hypothetical protein
MRFGICCKADLDWSSDNLEKSQEKESEYTPEGWDKTPEEWLTSYNTNSNVGVRDGGWEG